MIAVLAKLALLGALLAGSPVQATVTAPTHTPKIKTHWNYVLKATAAGKPAKGKLTVQIVDPIGGVHPVEFGLTTKKITNVAFSGTFRDFMIFPASSRGIPLKIRYTLKLAGGTKILNYAVTPH